MSIPLSLIVKELEAAPLSIHSILSSLHYDKSILINITKSETNHLISRTLNLTRSPDEYSKWCGTSLIRVLAENYALLSNHGIALLDQLLTNLENYSHTIDLKILTTTIDTINYICKQIRGKPTLTREILTPKLPSIITNYLEKVHFSPLLIVESLYVLVKNHPTTFRPFGNKLGLRLIGFLNLPEFCSFPQKLKNSIFKTLAVLPVIEKSEPEVQWETNIRNLIKEIVSILGIYGEFLNLNDDSDVKRLLQKLPSSDPDSRRILTPLNLDVNHPQTLFQISNNIEILLNLLSTYLKVETSFSVRVPLGLVVTLNELICTINLRFVQYKFDIRDDVTKSIIKGTTLKNHLNSVKLLQQLAVIYRGNILPHMTNILSFLEILIPFKNKKIDFNELLINEELAVALLTCVKTYLSLVGNLGDSSQLLRFVDTSLLLVEPRLDSSVAPSTKKTEQQQGKKNKKKKNNNAVAMSDLLSHQHLFVELIDKSTIDSVRSFLSSVISKTNLPPTQHYKIMRYLIIEAVNAKYYSFEKMVTPELRTLLVNSVLYPGFEKVSLLPIISQLIPQDPLLSVFTNPRFPPLPIYLKKIEEPTELKGFEDEEEEEQDKDQAEPSPKRRKTENGDSVNGENSNVGETLVIPAKPVDIEVREEEKIFVTKEVNSSDVISFPESEKLVETKVELEIRHQTETVHPAPIPSPPVVTSASAAPVEAEEDSDFEMPEIDVDGDSEEDE